MSKKTLLSALVVSSLSLSTLFASSTVEDETIQDSPNMVGFKNCAFSQFPLTTSTRGVFSQISFLDCNLDILDPSYFIDNVTLVRLSLNKTSADFKPFSGGKFGQGCKSLKILNLKDVSLKDGEKLTFEYFLSIASKDLLDQISNGTCELKFSRADSGKTLANFTQISDTNELSLDEIKRYISMYRRAQSAADQSASSNGGIWATVWSIFGSPQATK